MAVQSACFARWRYRCVIATARPRPQRRIEAVWHGVVTPPTRPDITTWPYGNVNLARGAEMGRFNMGSTVVLLFEPGVIEWSESMRAGSAIQMGQLLGNTMVSKTDR